MSRCIALFVGLLLSAVAAQAAVPIAPFEPFLGEQSYDDYNGDSASNGRSTLVVWENAFHPYTTTHSVHSRFLGRASELPVRLDRAGLTPAVASDGQDYLVAYGVPTSRFNSHPYDNVMVRRVSAEGVVGEPKAIHNSPMANGPSVGDIVWTGRYWMVAFTDATARIAFVARNLEPALPTLTLSALEPTTFAGAPRLVEIAGQWWAVYSDLKRTEAVEIRADGTAGRRYGTEVTYGLMGATGERGLFVYPTSTAEGWRLATSTFDPASGFGPGVVTSIAAVLEDVRSWNGSVLAIVREERFPSTWVDAVVFSAAGAVLEKRRLRSGEAAQSAAIGDGINGPVLLVSSSLDALPELDTRTGLYAWSLSSLPDVPLDGASRELVSIAAHGSQSAPLIASNGRSLVAFWTQTIDGRGAVASFSRPLVDGMPAVDITRLPFVIGPGDIAFDGERFLVVWQSGAKVFAASASADGRTASGPHEIGSGVEPEVAARDGVTFVVWKPLNGGVRGTALRGDGSPEVPDGFEILPSFTSGQGNPDIAAIDGGFLVLWGEPDGVKSVVISAAGTPRSSSRLTSDQSVEKLFLASEAGGASLAAWSRPGGGTLFAYGAAGRPFEPFDPHWGNWSPVSITAAGGGRFVVAFARDGAIFVANVSMNGGYITGLSQPRLYAPASATSFSVAPTESGSVAIWTDGARVLVDGAGAEVRRRSVARR